MNKKELLNEINKLEDEKKGIENKIVSLKNMLKIFELNNNLQDITYNYDNLELFKFYLLYIKNIKQSSVDAYCDSLDTMRDLIYEYLGIDINICFYYIDNLETFTKIIDIFENSVDLLNLNLKWHHSISAAYNNYKRFLRYNQNL